MNKELVTAAAVGAVVGAVVAVGAGALGLAGREKAAVSATIVLSPGQTQCVAQTTPATILLGKKDVLQWTVVGNATGNCAGVNPDDVEIQFVGACQTNGSKVSGSVPDLFEEAGALKGRKIKRTIKHNDGCFTYRIVHANVVLEDPELEIMQF